MLILAKVNFNRGFLVFIFLIGGIVCFGQKQSLRFKNLSVDDGLSQSWVRCIAQDKYGFIWIGTDDGLNRYDGNNFVIYRQDQQDSTSLNGNIVFSIFEDSKGNLWIGTIRGLNLFDRQSNRFIHKAEWPQFNVKSIIEDEDHNIWIGAGSSIYCISAKNQQIVDYSKTHPFWHNESIRINKLLIDKKKNFWIATLNSGLILFDRGRNTFEKYLINDESEFSSVDNRINAIAEDKYGRIWIGTKKGVDFIEPSGDVFAKSKITHFRYNTGNKNEVVNGFVLALLADNNNKLWVGIENEGLGSIDLIGYKKGIIDYQNYKNEPGVVNSLSNNSIYSLFQDKQGIIWIGTFGKGLDIINPFANRFALFTSKQNKNSIADNHVNVFCEDGNDIWIGTEGGLDRFNKKDKSFKHYGHNPLDSKSLSSNAVWSICKDISGNLWVGTWAGGLNQYNYKTETFTNYIFQKKDDPINNIFAIVDNKDGKLWLGTVSGGLLLFDTHSKTYVNYKDPKSNNSFEAIVKTEDGEIWLKNGNQKNQFVERFDVKTGNFDRFADASTGKSSLIGYKVYTIIEDSRHNIWIGTDGGLNRFVRENKTFLCWQIKDGLPDNSIRSIVEDNSGNLWLGTNKGLCKMEGAIKNLISPRFKNFITTDGIQGNEFVSRSCLKSSEGLLYFGGTNGFNSFNPDSLKLNSLVPNVLITDFLLFNKSVEAGTENSPLLKSILDTKEIILTHEQSVIGFRFSALNYIIPDKNQYAYQLEGFDKHWNYIGNKREVTYTNLDPGKYKFRVKASNNDGLWNEEGASITIIIKPPWWKTLWFRMLIITFLLLVFALFFYLRIEIYRKRQRELSELVKKRTSELEQTNIQLLQEQVVIAEQQETLQMANTSLQEQNQRIEEYAEEVNSQNEKLKMVNEQLLEQQARIEEQSEELSARSENLKEANDLLLEKQNLIQLQATTLETSNRELTLLNSTKDKLFSIIAHDLRNPFHAVIGFSEILLSDYKKVSHEKMERLLNLIYRSSVSGSALLENLLQWSRAQTGKILFEPVSFDMFTASKEVFALLEAEAMRKNIQLILSLEPDTKVFADVNMIKTVIRNLISNAIKFTREHGTISLKSEKHQSYVEFTVVDTGVGIPEQKVNLLFKVDTNISTKGTASEPGTGLGLILCKEFVEKNGGNIWVESEVNVGSKFKFTLKNS